MADFGHSVGDRRKETAEGDYQVIKEPGVGWESYKTKSKAVKRKTCLGWQNVLFRGVGTRSWAYSCCWWNEYCLQDHQTTRWEEHQPVCLPTKHEQTARWVQKFRKVLNPLNQMILLTHQQRTMYSTSISAHLLNNCMRAIKAMWMWKRLVSIPSTPRS